MSHNTKQIALVVVVVVVVLYGIHLYTNSRINDELEKAILALDANIAEQQFVLGTVADLTKQNDADEITKRVVVDCPANERQRFESLLDKLSSNITRTELVELERLFLACGSFFADRKAVMAARLVREVAVFEEYVNLRNRVVGDDKDIQEQVTLWGRVADGELKLAEDFSRLVDLQEDIIMALLAGKTSTSPEISATLKTVTETRNNMAVQVQQIESARSELLAI